MRYVTFVFVTLLLHAGMSMAQNGPPTSIGSTEGNPSAVACPAGQYLAGFNIWTEPQMSGLSPYVRPLAVRKPAYPIHLDPMRHTRISNT
jgi:hypothetical protein